MAVLQQATGHREYAVFGAAAIHSFPTVTLTGNVTTLTYESQFSLPCNVKVLAVSALASDGGSGGTGLGFNISSGPGIGTIGTGTVTYAGTNTGSAGTSTITIAGPTTGTSQVVTFAIGATNTATQSAAAAVTAINEVADSGGPQVFATSSAGVVTLYQLHSQSRLLNEGGAQTYKAVLSAAVATQTVTPLTATTYSAGTLAVGKSDNSGIGGAAGVATAVPPQTAGSGQVLFGRLHSIPVSTSGTNSVFYPGQTIGAGFVSTDWDTIFPVTRSLALSVLYTGYAASTTLQVSVLLVPYIMNPATSTLNAQWLPNNNTIGAPSTD